MFRAFFAQNGKTINNNKIKKNRRIILSYKKQLPIRITVTRSDYDLLISALKANEKVAAQKSKRQNNQAGKTSKNHTELD